MLKKIFTAFRLLLFNRELFVKRIFSGYFGRYDIFIFFVRTKLRSYFLTSKKRLFIDLGANVGQAYTFFSSIYPVRHYDYILVDPNESCVKELKTLTQDAHASIIHAAAWIQKGKKFFYGISESDNLTSLGASIIEDHKTGSYDVDRGAASLVDVFDFSSFLLEKSEIYSEIIVKMDIESSEYAVLEKLIQDKNIGLIDRLFVEFHSEWMKESAMKQSYLLREKKLIEVLPQFTKLHIWV